MNLRCTEHCSATFITKCIQGMFMKSQDRSRSLAAVSVGVQFLNFANLAPAPAHQTPIRPSSSLKPTWSQPSEQAHA